MDEKIQVKRYKVQHSLDEYTFPTDAYIHDVRFDEKYMHVELTDQRIVSLPLWWIPTIYNASDKDRQTFQISQDRKMIIWNPEKSGINDEINIIDYLGPARATGETGLMRYAPAETRKQVAEAKSKTKKK